MTYPSYNYDPASSLNFPEDESLFIKGRAKAEARREHQAAMTVVSDWAEACRILDKETWVALDLETTGLKHKLARIAVVGLYGPETNTAAVIHVRGQNLPKGLRDWLSSPKRKFITHNGTGFDLLFLAEQGINIRGPEWYDTLIGEQVSMTSDRKGVSVSLKNVLIRRLKITIPKDIDHETWMLPKLTDEQMRYIADDLYYLPRLMANQWERAAENDEKWGREGFEGVRDAMLFEQKLAPITASMMTRGLPINLQALTDYIKEQEAIMPEHRAWLAEHLDLHPPVSGKGVEQLNSYKLLRDTINEKYGLSLYSTDHDTLALLSEAEGEIAEMATRLLAWRRANKRDSMYDSEFIDKYIVSNRLYGQFWQVGTNTGRYSSSNPNLQQLPRDMRYVIADPSGESVIVAADYSAIEVIIAAWLYQDFALLKAIESGEDIHKGTAALLFGLPEDEVSKEQRRMAKSANFGLLFGGGMTGLYNRARADGSSMSRAEVEVIGKQYLQRFAGVDQARRKAWATAGQGRPVPLTFAGGLRRVLVPGPDLKGTTILNNSVQAAAARGLKEGIMLMDERGISQYLVAVVHDENVLNVPRALADEVKIILEQCMIEGMQRVTSAPVAVDAKGGETWQ